jgi:mono/diheme cytochrome c family protein
MSKLGWFLLGALALCAGAAVTGAFLLTRAHGFSAREQPLALERWVARWARGAALPADARSSANPVKNSPDVIAEARAHWADHCAVCHGNDGGGNTTMGKNFYPPAPDMRLAETQQMTDGELFYIIQNGIRMSGMPAWGGSDHDAQDSWKLVHFIRHLPQLTIEERIEMERLNPKGPDERKEEDDERKFLRGEENNETQHEHHH